MLLFAESCGVVVLLVGLGTTGSPEDLSSDMGDNELTPRTSGGVSWGP